jgi:NAD(P)-dependent dehydrogenase (short-subunit alcohol dehydrogenase family)
MDRLAETATETATDEGRLRLISADVRDRAGLKAAFSDLGPVFAIVANAGVCRRTWLSEEDSDAVWDDVIDTNVHGVWNTFRAVGDNLLPNGAAVIVSSGLGKLGRAGYAGYTASKHAVLGMVKCFAPELAGKGIRVNAVCPGWVDTEMAAADLAVTASETGKSVEAAKADAVSSIPLKRFVTAEEVANLTFWLLSDEARAITGQSYNISCGEFTV